MGENPMKERNIQEADEKQQVATDEAAAVKRFDRSSPKCYKTAICACYWRRVVQAPRRWYQA
jgi:hypothetical protein